MVRRPALFLTAAEHSEQCGGMLPRLEHRPLSGSNNHNLNVATQPRFEASYACICMFLFLMDKDWV